MILHKTIHKKGSDRANIEGELSIFVKPEGHEDKLLFFKGKNKITNKARAYLLQMVTEDPATLTPNPIVEFHIGSGGVGQTLDGTQTDLFSPIDPNGVTPYNSAVTVSIVPGTDNTVAEYAFEITTSELNGLNLSEVGLFCGSDWFGVPANGSMFNSKIFPSISKTSGFSLVFSWRINFSGVC